MSGRTLIRGGCVLTLGGKTPNFPEADILVDAGRVAEVGPGLRARNATVVDATDTIVMPGFVDAHRHVWKSLFRNLGDQGDDGRAATASSPLLLQPDDVYAATLVGLLGAVEAGITTVVDWSDLPLESGYTEAALQAHADVGLRTVFAPAVAAGGERRPEGERELERLLSGGDGRPSNALALGSRDVVGNDLPGIQSDWELARRLGLRVHAHAGTGAPGSIAQLAVKRLLGRDITLVHCTNLNAGDLEALAGTKAAVCLTPSAEMATGLGPPPIQQLIDRGIRPGLGIDDERFAPGDMFAQMRASISLQHAMYFDRKLAGKGGLPNLLTTREVIRYATSDGAAAAGLGEVTGSIEPGKQADIIMLRTDRPNIAPVNDPIGAVVWGMDTSNLDCVFVAGKALMRSGELQADTAEVRRLAGAARSRLASASGATTGAPG